MKAVLVILSLLSFAAIQGCVADWRGDAKTCEIHNQSMDWETKAISYGLPRATNWDDERAMAQGTEFPNARTRIWGGCISSWPPFAKIRYCDKCRIAEKDWLAEHPFKSDQASGAVEPAGSR